MKPTQDYTVACAREVFGEINMDDQRERVLRFGEEAMELMRAAGLSFKDIAALACYEFTRPKGELKQEIAGTQVTLFGLASAHKVDVGEEVAKECARILSKKDECRAKHAAKPASLVAQKAVAA